MTDYSDLHKRLTSGEGPYFMTSYGAMTAAQIALHGVKATSGPIGVVRNDAVDDRMQRIVAAVDMLSSRLDKIEKKRRADAEVRGVDNRSHAPEPPDTDDEYISKAPPLTAL